MEIEFDFELSDWMEFHKHYLQNSKQFKRTKLIIAAMMPLMMISIVTIDFLRGKVNTIVVVIFTIMSILWVVFYPKRMTKRTLAKSKKMIEDGDNSGLLGPHKIILNEDEIIHIQPDSEQKTQWKGIKKLEESETHYFLFNTAISAIIIPKHKINANLNELDQLLKSKLS